MTRLVWPKSFRGTRAADASAAEFDQLLREHVPALYRSAYRWTGSVDRAEDLVQELLVRLYPMLDDLRALDRVRPWVIRVMYRMFVDQLRRERSSPVQFGSERLSGIESADEGDEPIDPSEEPPSLADRQLTQERLIAAWKQLGEEHRVVLSMHDIEGYSLVELSSLMDIPIGTLKSRVHRARARLKALLGERFSISDRV